MVELVKGKALSEATAALMAESIAENARFDMWVAIFKNSHATEEELLSLADGDEAGLRRVLMEVTSELINIRMT
jgi:hypothetical protein